VTVSNLNCNLFNYYWCSRLLNVSTNALGPRGSGQLVLECQASQHIIQKSKCYKNIMIVG